MAATDAIRPSIPFNAGPLIEEIGRAANPEPTCLVGRVRLPEPLGIAPSEDPSQVGVRVLHRIERELYQVLCASDAKHQEERNSIRSAIGLGDAELTAALVIVLTSVFAVSNYVSVVAAAFIVKYVLRPAKDEFCDTWLRRISTF